MSELCGAQRQTNKDRCAVETVLHMVLHPLLGGWVGATQVKRKSKASRALEPHKDKRARGTDSAICTMPLGVCHSCHVDSRPHCAPPPPASATEPGRRRRSCAARETARETERGREAESKGSLY